ncbi:hypothetical protein Ntsu_40880 [Nocardia sp. IFM 10818]
MATFGPTPEVATVLGVVEASFDELVARAVHAIWAQVPAYAANADPRLRGQLTDHVTAVFGVLLTCARRRRPACREDFPETAAHARERVRQGVALPDFLRAFRIGQLTLWEGVVTAAHGDATAQQAGLALAGEVMRLIEVGSSLAAEAYLRAQQYELADSDRLRRDVLEDLLARRDIPGGPKRSLLRAAGLDGAAGLVVVAAAPVAALPADRMLREASSAIRKAVGRGSPGVGMVRHQEIVAVAPVPSDVLEVLDRLSKAVATLGDSGTELALGVSTVLTGPGEVPEGYGEAAAARDALGARAGVAALPALSAFDYLVTRDDPTARRMIRPSVRQFVEGDAQRGGELIDTLLGYVASDLNAKVTAERMYMHPNTAYNRLERIAERTGCDLRRFTDVAELVLAIRMLSPLHRGPLPHPALGRRPGHEIVQ